MLLTVPVPEKGVTVVGDTGGDVGNDEGEVVLETALRSPGDWPEYRGRGEALAGLEPFRTGDWGRREAGGAVRFLGRRSDYVKIRGFRVSLKKTERWLEAQEEIANLQAQLADQKGQLVPPAQSYE